MKTLPGARVTRWAAVLVFACHLARPALAAETSGRSSGRSWTFAGLSSPVKVGSPKELGALLTRSLKSAAAAQAQGAALNESQLAAFIQRTAEAAARLDGEVSVSWDAEKGELTLTSASGERAAIPAAAAEGGLSDSQKAKIETVAASLRALASPDIAAAVELAFMSKHSFDPSEGSAELAKLQALNADLAAKPRTPAELRGAGLLVDGSETVTRQSDERQIMPFRELLLPAAKTGMYAPKKQVPLNQVNGLVLFMPGIGTDISNAKTVLDVAGTLNKKGYLSFALDVTLNGMGRAMPFSFGRAEGMDAVAGHAVQVMKALYPGKPVYVAGRSQGGLVAVEYAARHDDVAGAVALSPSHPSTEIVKESIPWAENHPTLKIWAKAWEAYKVFTTAFKAAVAASRVPVLLLLDEGDDAYPQPTYFQLWSRWAAEQTGLRFLAKFSNPSTAERHNLWLRDARNNPSYERVIDAMVAFFAKASSLKPAAPAATETAAAPSAAAPAQAKTVSAADLAGLVKPDFSRKLKVITIQSDEFDAEQADAYIAQAKRLGVNELLVQDPSEAQAELMASKGAFLTMDWVHWKRDSTGFDEYISEFTSTNRAAMRKRVEAGKGVDYVARPFSAEGYAKVWKIWKQEIGSRPDALQFVPGVDIWPQDFAEKLLAGKTGNPEHGDVKDWEIITAEVDGEVVGGMVIQKRWDRGFVHGRMGAYLPQYVGRKEGVPEGTPVKNHFIEFNLSKKMMEVARAAGLQTSKGTDTGEPGYGTDVMLMHNKFDELYEVVPELHPVMRLVLTPGPNDYVIPTLDRNGAFARRYFAERAKGGKPMGRDVIGSFAVRNGWLTTKPDVLEAFYTKRTVSLTQESVDSIGNVRDQLIGRRLAQDLADGTGKTLVKAGDAFDAAAVAALKGSRVKSVKLIVEPAARRAHARSLLAGKTSAETGKAFTEAEIDALADGGAASVKIKVGKPGAEVITEIDLAHETLRGLSEKAAGLAGRRAAADVIDGTGALLMAAGAPMTAKDVGRLVQAGVTQVTLAVDDPAGRAKELLLGRVLAADVLGKNGKPVAKARQQLTEDVIAKIAASAVSDVEVWNGNPALDRIWGPFLHFTDGSFKPKVPRSIVLEQRPIAREKSS